MKKAKHVTSPIQADSPNLEHDSSKVAEINLNTEKILKLKARIAEIVTKIDNLKANWAIFMVAKDAMKKLDSDKDDPFTRDDIDTEIKLIKRKIHYYGYIKLKNEVKIEVLSAKEIYPEPESFERCLLELRLQEKETSQAIQDLELAIHALQKMFDEYAKSLSKTWEDLQIKGDINQEIQLLKKKKSENKSKLENIEEKIKILKEPKLNQDTFLVASHTKQLFFNGMAETSNSTLETEVKNFTF